MVYFELTKSLFKNPLPFISAKLYCTFPPELSVNCFTVKPAVTKSLKAYAVIETTVGTTNWSIVAGPTKLNAIPLIWIKLNPELIISIIVYPAFAIS